MENFWNWIWEDTRRFAKNGTVDGNDNEADLHDRLNELAYIPLISIAITLLRKAYERSVAIPFCKAWHLSDGSNRKPPKPNTILEKFYKKNKHPSSDDLVSLTKQLDMSVTEVRTWFRRKRNCGRPSLQKKFCETSWRFLFYTFLFSYGMYVLWQSTWFWDTQRCWEDFGHQPLHWPEYIYYMLESSFYLALLFSVMTDIKRKDFTEQMIHHFATLFLIIFSYTMTFVRIGTLVMAVHDISDIFLELAKCFHYIKKKTIAENLFVMFAIVFIISRLIIYPFWVIHTSAIKSLKSCTTGVIWYFFNALLIVLLLLHIFWTSLILKMARDMVAKGVVKKDERSDTEEITDDDVDNDKNK